MTLGTFLIKSPESPFSLAFTNSQKGFILFYTYLKSYLIDMKLNCRFALACNSSEKIIEPIQSRCAMLRYSKLSDAQVNIYECVNFNFSDCYI